MQYETSFISYLRDIRRYSPRTVSIYAEALNRYRARKGSCDPEVLTPADIREHEAFLMGSMKARTVHQQLSALSSYCRYLVQEGVLKYHKQGVVQVDFEVLTGMVHGVEALCLQAGVYINLSG